MMTTEMTPDERKYQEIIDREIWICQDIMGVFKATQHALVMANRMRMKDGLRIEVRADELSHYCGLGYEIEHSTDPDQEIWSELVTTWGSKPGSWLITLGGGKVLHSSFPETPYTLRQP